jgi:hypothetical protein
MNKLRTALKYLEKAQRIEMKSRVVANPAGTRLNLCAVLSQLERWLTPRVIFCSLVLMRELVPWIMLTVDEDRHGEALEHAQAAVVLLQEELAQLELTDDYEENSPETLNKMAVLAISYHNIGAFSYDDDAFYLFLQKQKRFEDPRESLFAIPQCSDF